MFSKKKENKIETKEDVAVLAAKLRKQTILVFVTFLVSLSMLGVSSMAWFAMNRTVDSTGMKMQTEVTPNLIIAKSVEDLKAITASNLTTSNFSVEFTDAAKVLAAAHHNSEMETSLLEYPTNPTVIGFDTGVASGGSIIFAEAINNAGVKEYYVDYTVYIASCSTSMAITGLTAEISGARTDGEALHDYQKASSVDFYVGSVSKANFKGTLNLAGKVSPDGNEDKTSVDILRAAADSTVIVPYNQEGNIPVIMRFYFDGALEKSSNLAYVRSAGLELTDFIMAVQFTAE